MTIPIYFFPGLNTIEIFAFEVIQTLLNFGFMVVLMLVGIRLLEKDKLRKSKKDIIITCIAIEIGDLITSALALFLFLFVLAGVVLIIFLYFATPLLIQYLRYYDKNSLNELRFLVLFILSFPPALFASAFLAAIVFNAMGIHCYFIFAF